eukprot:XP_017948839.1 PREDICTED: uncharacterized protein LOC108647387 [Xenopus tropicalis]
MASREDYMHWQMQDLQERARVLGLNYAGVPRETLVERLVQAAPEEDLMQPEQRDHRPQVAPPTNICPWATWAEETLRILGPDATLEDRRDAINGARQLYGEHMALRRAEAEAHTRKNQAGPLLTQSCVPRISRKEFKAFDESKGDIDGFFRDFEHQCMLEAASEQDQVRVLSSLLTGSAAEAYRDMAPELKMDYHAIKETVLAHYAITPESYRLRFREARPSADESFKRHGQKLSQACRRWLQGELADSAEDIIQLILKEQFYLTCPREITEWVKERKPSTIDEATALADEALLIKPQWKRLLEGALQPSAPAVTSSGARPQPTPPPSGAPPRQSFISTRPNPPSTTQPQHGNRPQDRLCYLCRQPGHMQYACPKARGGMRPMASHPVNYVEVDPEGTDELPPSSEEWSFIPTPSVIPRGVYGIQKVPQSYPEQRKRHLHDVLLDGCHITGFRDSGAFLTIADPQVVRPEAIHPGPGILIEVAGGELKYIPKAAVQLDYGCGEKVCWIGVMGGLPADVLLGNDLGPMDSCFVGAVAPTQAQHQNTDGWSRQEDQ